MDEIACLYAVETQTEFETLQQYALSVDERLKEYICVLKRDFAVRELPRAIVWTTGKIATGLISAIPVPAYTNDYRIIFAPDMGEWRKIYLSQLDGLTGPEAEEIRSYYENKLSGNNILQILGHELAHHSEYFTDSAYETDPWFEEGMAEYISRRLLLTEAEFDAETRINRTLVNLLSKKFGGSSEDLTGAREENPDYAALFLDYWRGFLKVKDLVDAAGGDVLTVLQKGVPS